MSTLSKFIAPAVFAAGLAFSALLPAPAHAQDDGLTRVIVDVADVVLRGGQPYYRYGNYRDVDRLIVARDRYGRPVYYRVVDRRWNDDHHRYAYRPYVQPYVSHGYNNTASRVTCNSRGNCTVSYYDPQYDRRGYRKHRRGHGRDDD
ncbi:hypothetical protein LF41_1765 [Lysobacter dokdonensis DS-58]|uniref:Uncharacterized protein n=1 Tax=Lysobacter dokdonensis DS-58 TaxID=1300345 RepID=A0A0A2WCT2_9GAMM|nr:hypothetical protein [Lysobacter dokdonensis]KGQ17911.1 hypothetical protein LF41_1765 [Lysobacter dokdonensis DS-58]